MSVLKKENWWVWLFLFLFSNGTSTFVLGALLDIYDKKAWYAKWYYWVIGFVCFMFPGFVMITIFQLEILCKTCAKLKVPGAEYYLSPYLWLLCCIIPFIGWIILVIAVIYLSIASLIALYKGNGENYINNK